MGIIEKIGGFFTGLGSLPGEVLKGAEAAWHAIQTVWSFLTDSYGVLSSAWTWVVNGWEWLGKQLTDWAGEVFNTLWQTLTETIPDAIVWVFDRAVKEFVVALARVYNELRGALDAVYKFLLRLIHGLINDLKAALHAFIKWATNPVRWVLHWGAWLIHLLTHPENIANWIAGAIIEPVVKWLVRSGSHVVVWALRMATTKDSAFAHLVEDVLHDLL